MYGFSTRRIKGFQEHISINNNHANKIKICEKSLYGKINIFF